MSQIEYHSDAASEAHGLYEDAVNEEIAGLMLQELGVNLSFKKDEWVFSRGDLRTSLGLIDRLSYNGEVEVWLGYDYQGDTPACELHLKLKVPRFTYGANSIVPASMEDTGKKHLVEILKTAGVL